jgi:hypothetical protein
METALEEPVESLDENKPVALTKSIYIFNELIKRYIDQMTGQVRKPYHGLNMRCRRDQCTYKLKTKEIISDGNCLFDSLLYILGRHQTHASQMALRRELYQHYIINGDADNRGYDFEVAKSSQHVYASTHVIKSFTEIYRRNVIVFELHNSGVFNAFLFINREIPFDSVDFLILTQNPGHFTTFTKDRTFVQSRMFLEKILNIDSYFGGLKIRDLIIPGQRIADFNERNYSQRIFANYDEFEDVMTTDVALPPLPDNLGLPPLPPRLAPLLPLNTFPIGSNEDMYPTSAELRTMVTPKSGRSASHGSRSSSLSPATKAAIAAMNRRTPRSGSTSGSRSPSLSPATKAQIAEMNKHARSRSARRYSKSKNRSGSGRRRSRSRSRSGSLSPATKQALANMNSVAPYLTAPNASPATKQRIAQLALNEAPNASVNTMNQIARIGRIGRGQGPVNSPRSRRSNSGSPVADLRRTRRFRPSSIVGRNIARPFAKIFGKF